MTEYSVVGKRLSRIDALEKVTGAALFSNDVILPGMLHSKVLRSPYPHAIIRRLDVTKAEKLEGVMAVITAADVPGYQRGKEMLDPGVCHLAVEKVLFVGQPIAAVAATSLFIAEEALKLIEIEYEELSPVLDVFEAMKADTPRIHPGWVTQGAREGAEKNVAFRVVCKRGDVEKGFQEAEVILENTYCTPMVHQGYLEPMTAVASTERSGKITVWTSSQGIFHVRELLAKFMAMPLSQIKVMPVDVGGGFGGKTYQLVAPLCALLSRKTGRPVKMVMTREEVLKASRPAPASVITIKLGVTKEGRLTAASAKMIFDEGAFPERSFGTNAALTGLSLYKIPNLEIDAFDVFTNKVPAGSYRAPAAGPAAFAVESQMDLIARALQMDPLQLRMLNAATKGDPMTDGAVFGQIGFKETLKTMVDHLAQRGKVAGKDVGRGVACGFWRGGTANSSASVIINSDGSVNLLVGCTDITGVRTSLAQIVAEEFGIPFAKVAVTTGNTETAPYSDVSTGSRTTHGMGIAVQRACQDAKTQLAHPAARKLGVQVTDLQFTNGQFQVKGTPGKSVPFCDLARDIFSNKGEGPIVGRGSVGKPDFAPMFAVHAADVQVDKETGKVKILSYIAAQDVGLAINPMLIEGQMDGAISQGIGWALMENYVFNKGVLQNTSLLDYRMPTATDQPFKETMLVEVKSDSGTYGGLRPAGEPPMVPALAAIANAIDSAVGVRIKETPMSPETVLWSLRHQKK